MGMILVFMGLICGVAVIVGILIFLQKLVTVVNYYYEKILNEELEKKKLENILSEDN